MTDPWAAKIAQFVIQALELDVDPGELASEIVPLKRDAEAGISALELRAQLCAERPFQCRNDSVSELGGVLVGECPLG